MSLIKERIHVFNVVVFAVLSIFLLINSSQQVEGMRILREDKDLVLIKSENGAIVDSNNRLELIIHQQSLQSRTLPDPRTTSPCTNLSGRGNTGRCPSSTSTAMTMNIAGSVEDYEKRTKKTEEVENKSSRIELVIHQQSLQRAVPNSDTPSSCTNLSGRPGGRCP